MAEKKMAGRDVGGYTAEGLPARGGPEGSKRIGGGELNALISHGATNVIRDAQVVRGQRNDDYWRAVRLGYPPPSPKVPVVYDKFLATLQASGINLKKRGDTTQLFALTDSDVDEMSSGPITTAKTVKGRGDLDPVKNGLFDVGKTGGHGGGRWAHIELATPMPNPVMEEPIRRLLGLTKKKFEGVIGGTEKIETGTGTEAIYKALKKINVPTSIRMAKEVVSEGTGAKRDQAVKLLGYLQTLDKAGIAPHKLMMTKVPVLPPNFRPISASSATGEVVSDANYLYVDLMRANEDYAALRKELGDDHAGDERLQIYKGFKALSGLGDPIAAKSQGTNVKGLLKHVFGDSPKMGMFQRRIVGAAVDTVGRGVITPNPSLNMDQVGLPEKKAWIIYRPHVMRNLTRRGMGAMAAARNIADQTDVARKALIEAMSQRPVFISRAPALHRYSMMAFWPLLTKGDTLQIPPIVTPGFNADFDGDTMNFHVPATEEAVQDAVNKMLPSRNLRAVRDFDVHYYPRQEFLLGLHLASTAKKKGTKTFRSKADVIAAYKRGELGVDDQITILR
jgi:DNA-directed RNA polymerase beta' subunit